MKLPNEERPIGKYGRMQQEYLKEHNPMLLFGLAEGYQKRYKFP
ncbi:MAG: TnpV protein [Blautia sp.]|nr:TnpV protein [Blautia sp.]